MKKRLIKIGKVALVGITIATMLILTCYADNQVSRIRGQVTSTQGIVWCSYNVGDTIVNDHQHVLFADNINISPTFIPTQYPYGELGEQSTSYYTEDITANKASTPLAITSWESLEIENYTSPVTNEVSEALVGLYYYNFSLPDILVEYATNNMFTIRISFEDIITWNEDYINVGDKQNSITPLIRIKKEYVNNINDLVGSGQITSEVIGKENETTQITGWKPYIIDQGNEYWIACDNMPKPSQENYKSMYKNSGHFTLNLKLSENNPDGAPHILCESEVIVLRDIDSIIQKQIIDNQEDPKLISVADFGSWIANSISGFMNFTIMEGVSIGGIFIMLISFATVMWLLKLFAGG